MMMATGADKKLKFRTPLFPYVTLFGIWAQVFCLVVMFFTPDLQEALYAGLPMLILPMCWYKLRARRRKAVEAKMAH